MVGQSTRLRGKYNIREQFIKNINKKFYLVMACQIFVEWMREKIPHEYLLRKSSPLWLLKKHIIDNTGTSEYQILTRVRYIGYIFLPLPILFMRDLEHEILKISFLVLCFFYVECFVGLSTRRMSRGNEKVEGGGGCGSFGSFGPYPHQYIYIYKSINVFKCFSRFFMRR